MIRERLCERLLITFRNQSKWVKPYVWASTLLDSHRHTKTYKWNYIPYNYIYTLHQIYVYVCLLVCVRAGCEVNQSTRNPICFYRQLCHRIMCSRDGDGVGDEGRRAMFDWRSFARNCFWLFNLADFFFDLVLRLNCNFTGDRFGPEGYKAK